MRSRLYFSNNAVAMGSPASTARCDDRIHDRSHARWRRSVTPFRSGPTRSPLPYVWQALHFFANNAAGSVAANVLTGNRSAAPKMTARRCAGIDVMGIVAATLRGQSKTRARDSEWLEGGDPIRFC